MKKILLFVVIVTISYSLMAQTPKKDLTKALLMPQKSLYLNKPDQVILPSYGPLKPKNYTIKNINTLNKIPFTSSFNIFTALLAESNCLTYDPNINTIMFTHRAGGQYGGNGNQITFSYTSDMGSTFKHVTVDSIGQKLRYPSGVIYNPNGNTNPDNAYGLAMGPSYGGTSWDSYYYMWSKLDSTNISITINPDNAPPLPQYFPRIGFAACDDSTQHIMGYFDDGNHGTGTYNIKYLVMNNFKFNPSLKGGFDWTTSTVQVPLFNAPTSGTDVYSGFNTAWSQDGSIGYMWIFGVDSLDPNLHTLPIVYKSTDKGANWTRLPYFDFSTNDTIMSRLNDWWQGQLGYPGTPRINFVDWYSGSDGIVDANGNLHIFTLIGCGYGITNDPDSLGYIYSYEPKVIYDVYTTSTGWDVWVVDTILTEYVPAASSGFGSGADAVGWDHRIQATRSYDGTKIFCVWTDSDTTFTTMVNIPDIIARGYDINTGYKTPSINFTVNTAYDGDNFFMYVADRVISQGNDYIIPIVTADIGATPDDPPTFELLTGVSFNETDFTSGIKTYNDGIVSILQNYPNPCKDYTNLNISLQKPSNVTVYINNLMGQEVLKINVGTKNIGNHNIKINTQNLKPGLYFYTVQANNSLTSGKLIVE